MALLPKFIRKMLGRLSPDEILLSACISGNLEEVSTALQFGANPNIVGRTDDNYIDYGFRQSAVETAIVRGHLDIMNLLIQHGCDVNYDDGTLLTGAIIRGNPDVVRALLRAGARPSKRDLGRAIQHYTTIENVARREDPDTTCRANIISELARHSAFSQDPFSCVDPADKEMIARTIKNTTLRKLLQLD